MIVAAAVAEATAEAEDAGNPAPRSKISPAVWSGFFYTPEHVATKCVDPTPYDEAWAREPASYRIATWKQGNEESEKPSGRPRTTRPTLD